jgi:hypothetical protein
MLHSGIRLRFEWLCLILISSGFDLEAQPVCSITGGSEHICYGTSTIWSGPTGMQNYSWTGPDDFNASTQEITVSAAGLYTLTITDLSGTSTCTRDLVADPELMPGSINTTLREFCTGGTTVIGGTNPPYGPATGGSGLYNYTWQMQTGCTGDWTDIPGTNLTSYTPAPPPSTTCYRRKAEDPICGSVAWTDSKTFIIYEDPASQSIVPVPADPVICAGTPASATFTGGSGGFPDGTTDVYEYSINGGSTWSGYSPGQIINTAGLDGSNIVRIRTRRIPTGVAGCNYGSYVTFSWSVNPVPVTSAIYHR